MEVHWVWRQPQNCLRWLLHHACAAARVCNAAWLQPAPLLGGQCDAGGGASWECTVSFMPR